MTRRNERLSAEDNARIDELVRQGKWRQCSKCQMRLPAGTPCGCDPAAMQAFAHKEVFDEGGICRPCRRGHHLHGICIPIAGCKCKAGEESKHGKEEKPPEFVIVTGAMMEEIDKVVAYAEAHPLDRDRDGRPGNRSEYAIQVGVIQCVFCLVKVKDSLLRHLTLAFADDPEHIPHPETMEQVAGFFGFIGKMGEDYSAARHELDRNVICAWQEVARKGKAFDA